MKSKIKIIIESIKKNHKYRQYIGFFCFFIFLVFIFCIFYKEEKEIKNFTTNQVYKISADLESHSVQYTDKQVYNLIQKNR